MVKLRVWQLPTSVRVATGTVGAKACLMLVVFFVA